MTINEVEKNISINNTFVSGKGRVLDKNFNVPINEINNGSKVNEPLMSLSNSVTGESFEIHRSDIYSENSPIYIIKGKTAEGKEFERKLDAWFITPRNCSYVELMVLNQEIGNTSIADKQRTNMLFDNIINYISEKNAKGEDIGKFENYLDKADYSAAANRVMEELMDSGNWDSYLSMTKWKQNIDDYTSVPVYFTRDIVGQTTVERNGVKSTCDFAKVQTQEEMEKEWADRFKNVAKNKKSIREVLKNTYPNAENMLYGVVGSSRVMTFDEYVKDTEEMLRKLFENSNKQ